LTKDKNISYNELRAQQYSYNYNKYPELKKWRKNPYSFLKAILYMECSAIFVLLLLKTKIKPNTITMLYIISGIVGLILLSIPLKESIIISLIIFFLKGIFDWSDGHLARLTNQSSLSGHILDVFGAHVNELGFFIGIGFFNYNYLSIHNILHLIPIYPLLVTLNLVTFSKGILFDEHKMKRVSSGNNIDTFNQSKPLDNESSIKSTLRVYIIKFLYSFLDSRARTVDLICLIVLFELYIPLRVTWIIFVFLVLKQLLITVGSFYIFLRDNWLESIVEENN
jgi:hypothetical protein